MKKTFEINHPKIKPARRIDAIKHEIKKYVKRERNKTLPQDVDYWDFDCKFGSTEQVADVVHLSELNKNIDNAVTEGATSFYIEIMAKTAIRQHSEDHQGEEEE
jgi:hypothetical protein